MVHQISVRVADVHDELRRVLKHLDEFPSPQSVEEVDGPSNRSVRRFYVQLSATAREAAGATTIVMEDLTNHDADLAESADTFESFLDSAAEHPALERSRPVEGKGGGSYLPGSNA